MLKTLEVVKSVGRIFKSGYNVAKKADNLNDYIYNLPEIKNMCVDGRDIKLTVDTDAVVAAGVRFGMSHFMVKDNKVCYTIILEDKTRDMGSDVCQFIINHEIGHFVNEVFGHYFIFNNGRNLQNEMNADLYAVRQIGVKRTLNALITLSTQKGIDRGEIRKRIQNVKLYSIANPNNK